MGEVIAGESLPDYDSARPRRWITDEIRELVRYKDLVRLLLLRDLTVRYRRSALGILWTLLDPLMTMGVMAFVFSAILNDPVPDFPVFLLSGVIVWTFFSQASAQAISDIIHGDTLFGKVYIPKTAIPAAAVGAGLVNLFLALGPMLLVVALYGRPVTFAWLFLPVAGLIVAAFTLGMGLLMAALALYLGDMQTIYGIVLRLLMYMSGVFYTVDMLPGQLQILVQLNPTYHLIELVRAPIYFGTLPEVDSLLYALAWSVALLLVGLRVFGRSTDQYAYLI